MQILCVSTNDEIDLKERLPNQTISRYLDSLMTYFISGLITSEEINSVASNVQVNSRQADSLSRTTGVALELTSMSLRTLHVKFKVFPIVWRKNIYYFQRQILNILAQFKIFVNS